jgi:aryl-alcohol dehydrogenase-like predicted oxidoreductase
VTTDGPGPVTDNADRRRRLGPFSVAPVGFGAMRLAGPNVFGPPKDRGQAIAVLREAVDLGVDHIDTAQFYGPDIVNELIREALHPYPPQLVIVSKVGASRDTRGGIHTADTPEQLRHAIEDTLRTLAMDTLPVVNLRLMRPSGPDAFFDDQLAAMIAARDDGLIASIGLSNITLDRLLYAVRVTDVACVQNAFHLANRTSQTVLDECTRRRIAFVPFASLGFGATGPNSVLYAREVVAVARRLGCTSAQVALAWALAASPNVLVIPGTSSLHHLQENLGARSVQLDAEAVHELSLGTKEGTST